MVYPCASTIPKTGGHDIIGQQAVVIGVLRSSIEYLAHEREGPQHPVKLMTSSVPFVLPCQLRAASPLGLAQEHHGRVAINATVM